MSPNVAEFPRSEATSEAEADGLSPKLEAALAAVLLHHTQRAAAEALDVDPKTLRRWMADPDFIAAYRAARSENLRAVTARLTSAADGAIDALEAVVADEASPPAAKVAAARTILAELHGASAQEALEERIGELEAIAGRRR